MAFKSAAAWSASAFALAAAAAFSALALALASLLLTGVIAMSASAALGAAALVATGLVAAGCCALASNNCFASAMRAADWAGLSSARTVKQFAPATSAHRTGSSLEIFMPNSYANSPPEATAFAAGAYNLRHTNGTRSEEHTAELQSLRHLV